MRPIYWMAYWTGYCVSWVKWTLGIKSTALSHRDCDDGEGIALIDPVDEEPLTLDSE